MKFAQSDRKFSKADINIKIEPIKEFNRSMEIITEMNVPVNVEIKKQVDKSDINASVISQIK